MKTFLTSLILVVACSAFAGPFDDLLEGTGEKRAKLDLMQGKPPPALQVSDWMNSEAISLADLKGKVVVLDFWATWCGPCIRSIPHTNEMMEKYKDKVVIIGICQQRGAEKMEQMAKDEGIKYPIAKDIGGNTVDAFNVNSFPDYFLIDQAGNLVIADCQNSKVEEAIDRLLK